MTGIWYWFITMVLVFSVLFIVASLLTGGAIGDGGLMVLLITSGALAHSMVVD